MNDLDATHDASRHSFVEAANRADAEFPLQNLPFGVFRRPGQASGRGGVAIGDKIFDLAAAREAGFFSGAEEAAAAAAGGPTLNGLMALGNEAASILRARLCDLLDATSSKRKAIEASGEALLVPMSAAEMMLPTQVGSFTDFLTSGFHSTRLSPTGKLALNFMSMPIAYHSRASSVRAGGTVTRPHGQWLGADNAVRFGPTRQLDYELEVGAFIGLGNALGHPVPVSKAPNYLFGYCLLNDWSVRDIQRWESAPLGPFLAKSLSTTISPWVVTEAAMRPFRVPAYRRAEGEPPPLPYLSSRRESEAGGFDLNLFAEIRTTAMRDKGLPPLIVTKTNFKHMYWTFAQMATHHMSNGCNLMPGDIIGSGTTSGPTSESRACLAELTVRGKEPITLPNGETRAWLEDGDEITLRARAEREGYRSVGFGECRGIVGPALAWPE